MRPHGAIPFEWDDISMGKYFRFSISANLA
ncbi:hypothetical protein BN126330029 [Stenotrophomonas indicatrix]|nr:hypothetical protein BN126330029 [Stenotrophomonas indicatrix]